MHLAPVNEDSYRSKPDPSFEDSKAGVNKRLNGVGVRDDGSPKDFGFLLKNRGAEASPQQFWSSEPNLNASAPEFVPTSPAGEGNLEDAHARWAAMGPSDGEDEIVRQRSCPLMGAKEGEVTPPPTSAEARRSLTGPLARMSRRKRRQVNTNPLPRKRTRNNSNGILNGSLLGTPKACNFSESSEDAISIASAQDALSIGVCSASTLERYEMPEATEEDWRHREEQRAQAILRGKESSEYLRLRQLIAKDEEAGAGAPTTPNPYDRTISKRRWKESINQWRYQVLKYTREQEEKQQLEEQRATEPEGV